MSYLCGVPNDGAGCFPEAVVRLAGGNANNGTNAGASNSNTNNSATNTNANISAPLYLTVIKGRGLGTGQKIATKKVLVGFEVKLDGSEDI